MVQLCKADSSAFRSGTAAARAFGLTRVSVGRKTFVLTRLLLKTRLVTPESLARPVFKAHDHHAEGLPIVETLVTPDSPQVTLWRGILLRGAGKPVTSNQRAFDYLVD